MNMKTRRRLLVLVANAVLFAPQILRATDVGPEVFAAISAADIDQDELIYVRRPVIVFADLPNDPNYIRQMEYLGLIHEDLQRRDVVLITDTDPAHPSELRKRLRPRGFTLVLMDKGWDSALRKPLPWQGREIINAIDKMPIARAEAFERNPSGR